MRTITATQMAVIINRALSRLLKGQAQATARIINAIKASKPEMRTRPYTLQEAAPELRCSVKTLMRMIHAKQIRTTRRRKGHRGRILIRHLKSDG